MYGGSLSAFNNPLRLRRPWTRGCASSFRTAPRWGEHIDIDRGPDGPSLASFDLFQRLMDEARYHGRLFGDISAVTQANRAESILTTLIRRVGVASAVDQWIGLSVARSDAFVFTAPIRQTTVYHGRSSASPV